MADPETCVQIISSRPRAALECKEGRSGGGRSAGVGAITCGRNGRVAMCSAGRFAGTSTRNVWTSRHVVEAGRQCRGKNVARLRMIENIPAGAFAATESSCGIIAVAVSIIIIIIMHSVVFPTVVGFGRPTSATFLRRGRHVCRCIA